MILKVQLITNDGKVLITEEEYSLDGHLQSTFLNPFIVSETKDSQVLMYGYKIVPNILVKDIRTGQLF